MIMKNPMTRLVIFDLDGTLLDTIGDLAVSATPCWRARTARSTATTTTAVSSATASCGRRGARAEPLRTPFTVDAVRRDFVAYYLEHIDEHTVPYEGIPELLAELQRRGVRLAVASNKFQAGTEKLAGRYFPGIRFDVVLGQRPDVPLKPDPAVVGEILAATGVAAAEVLYVGDSGVDMQTAAAAGVRSAGVTWGFRSREELEQSGARTSSTGPAELLDLL